MNCLWVGDGQYQWRDHVKKQQKRKIINRGKE